MMIKLTRPFASNSNADESDVRQIKKALNRLGYYMPLAETGVTGIPDADVFAALRAFQRDQGLAPTGEARPGDETVRRLGEQASQKQSGKYIWRSVGDEKVRPAHAELNGTIRDLSDSPDPTEEPNCRCWMEPFNKAKDGKLCIDLYRRHADIKFAVSEDIPEKIAISENELKHYEDELEKWKEQEILALLPSVSFPNRKARLPVTINDMFDFLGLEEQVRRIESIREKIQEIEETILGLKNKIKRLHDERQIKYQELLDVEEQIKILCPHG